MRLVIEERVTRAWTPDNWALTVDRLEGLLFDFDSYLTEAELDEVAFLFCLALRSSKDVSD